MTQNNLNYLLSNILYSWNEISVLLETAGDCEESKIELHDAICRSVSVLMVANLEGFYKKLIKSIIQDLNDNNSFDTLPKAVQRSYCDNFIDNNSTDKAKQAITSKLIAEFERLNANIDFKPFLSSKNKNPKPSVINTIFQNLGIKKVFHLLKASRYYDVFEQGNTSIEENNQIYLKELNLFTQGYPYKYNVEVFTESSESSGKTLWEEFLDDINKNRHEIAHGNESNNIDSVSGLIKRKNKIICLQLALIHILVEEFGEVNVLTANT